MENETNKKQPGAGKTTPSRGNKDRRRSSLGNEIATTAARTATSEIVKRSIAATLPHVAKLASNILTANHPEWYTQDTTAKLVGLNFAANKAIPVTMCDTYRGDVQYQSGQASVVGITTIDLPPHDPAGALYDGWDAGIAQLQNALRAANNSSISYDTRDLERYVIHVTTMHTLYAFGVRMLGILNDFSSFDTALPRAYFSAMGIDYATAVANSAQLRTVMQQLSTFLATTAPLKMSLIDRKRWLYGNVFVDSPKDKATPIIFTPASFPRATISSGDLGVANLGYFGTVSRQDAGEFITMVTNAIRAFGANAAYANIAGDIIKAYGREAFYPEVDLTNVNNTKIVHIYDENTLAQIENGVVIGNAKLTYAATDESVSAGFNVEGDDPTRTYYRSVVTEQSNKFLVNSHDDVNSSGEVMSLTRFICGATQTGDRDIKITWHNSEIMTNIWFVTTAPSSANTSQYDDTNDCACNRLHSSMYLGQSSPDADNGWMLASVSMYNQTKGMPSVWLTFGNSVEGVLQTVPFIDLDVYAITTAEVLRSINYSANKSMMYVPVRLRVTRTETL